MLLIILLLVSVLFIVISTTKFKLHPFIALLLAAIGFGLFSGMPLPEIVKSVNNGFGTTIGYIGIVIVAGCIIGTFLEESGGAYIMAQKLMKLVGEKHVPLAMVILGYFVSIPVYADSGFVVLSPLNKALSKKAKISLAGPAIALGLGLTITHCLIPPTPGPIAAAGILEADIGLVIIVGGVVSLFAVIAAWIFATKFASKVFIDPNPDKSEEEIIEQVKEAPSAVKAFIPIVIPLLLIVLKSLSDFPTNPLGTGFIKTLFGFIGEPVIALIIGVFFAFQLPKKFERSMLSTTGWVGKALLSSAVIILITGAGGAFGMVLRNSGIADILGSSLSEINLSIWLPFIIAASLKSAQGSSTVAVITTASIMAPLMLILGFDSPLEKALVISAIGAGSMVVSQLNDSFFWVVTQFSNMNVKTGLKLHTLGTLVCGSTSMLVVWMIHLLFC
ncbi:GntP family permease [uncultured Draconibacterium sp.]|uniref:GntP family permease n=1 Tax=uncultured Draconibacterium sp. TaxID=1573823 RepID=UPI0029C685AE|nr:GntP family permease [uncultured Draconibacterium sp.]